LFLPSLRAETEFSLKAVEEGTKEAGVSFSAETDAAVDCWEGISEQVSGPFGGTKE
jgi:hypothetical protein